MNVEIAFVGRVNEQLVTGQGEFALMAFIDQHRMRTRTDDDDASVKILHLQRCWNAFEKDFAVLEILDGHVFAVDFVGFEVNEFIVLVGYVDTAHRRRQLGFIIILARATFIGRLHAWQELE